MDMRVRKKKDESIRLTADCHWYNGEYPILHERTVSHLHKNIALTEDGRYYLTGEEKPIFIEVEDTAYWIIKLERTIAGYLLTLSDESVELLNPDTLWVGSKTKALYCMIKGGYLPARFSQSTHYELLKDAEEKGSKYVIKIMKKTYEIGTQQPKMGIFAIPKRRSSNTKERVRTRSKARQKLLAAQKKEEKAIKKETAKKEPVTKKAPAKKATSKKATPKKAAKKTEAKKKPAAKKTATKKKKK